MITSEKNKLGKPLYILYPGDYYATANTSFLGTVAGISVVVCLYDRKRGIGGMGHLIIPGLIGTEGIISDAIAKEGIMSMELIMAEIVKLGGDRKDLCAKIFGAGYIKSDTGDVDPTNIIQGNLKFLKEYFKLEKIEVEKEDFGGNCRRKLFFNPRTGQVFRKLLKNNETSSEFIRLEKEYIKQVFQRKETYGEVVLF